MGQAHEPPYFATMGRRILGAAQVQEGVAGLSGLEAGPRRRQQKVRVGRAFAKAL
jgi:hypothetical protein